MIPQPQLLPNSLKQRSSSKAEGTVCAEAPQLLRPLRSISTQAPAWKPSSTGVLAAGAGSCLKPRGQHTHPSLTVVDVGPEAGSRAKMLMMGT